MHAENSCIHIYCMYKKLVTAGESEAISSGKELSGKIKHKDETESGNMSSHVFALRQLILHLDLSTAGRWTI